MTPYASYQTLPCPYRQRVVEDRFFDLVKSMSVAMADRCQDGLLDCEMFGKTVVAAAGSVMIEFLYASGERQRPMSAEDRAKFLDSLAGKVGGTK